MRSGSVSVGVKKSGRFGENGGKCEIEIAFSKTTQGTLSKLIQACY